MPFLTPEYRGKKEALEYLEQYPTVSKANFMEEGRAEIERDFREASSQQRYIKGWDSAWDEVREGNVLDGPLLMTDEQVERLKGD
jgi:hypothetical protein